MNRRTYFKSILVLGSLGVSSFSLYKWFKLKQPISAAHFHDKSAVLEELVDLIIPATDSPGAKNARVHEYIINVIVNCNSLNQQNIFYNGIEDLEKYAHNTYNRTFLKCSFEEKRSILTYTEVHTGFPIKILNKIQNKFLGKPFYTKLRELTIEGYCLSKVGATLGLAYDYIPVDYQACIPLRVNQKSWATK
jgi:hypothetical protein